jgi:hypothetical protein
MERLIQAAAKTQRYLMWLSDPWAGPRRQGGCCSRKYRRVYQRWRSQLDRLVKLNAQRRVVVE